MLFVVIVVVWLLLLLLLLFFLKTSYAVLYVRMNKCSLQFGISTLNICSKMSLSLIFLFMLFITCWDSNIKLMKRGTTLIKLTVNLKPNLCVQSTQNTTCSMLGNRVLSRYNIDKPCNSPEDTKRHDFLRFEESYLSYSFIITSISITFSSYCS